MNLNERELTLLIACVDAQIANAQRTGITVVPDLRRLLRKLEKAKA